MNMCTTHKAEQLLNVSASVIQFWIESGILKAWKTPGGHRRITLTSIQQVANKNKSLMSGQLTDDAEIFTILYVEDNEALSDIFCQLFGHLSPMLRINHTTNGQDALISLGLTKPDLLVTDLNMPRMNGFEMIRYIRNNTHFNKTLIAVMTGLNKYQMLEYVGLPNDVAVYSKPSQFEALGELIESLVMSKSMSANDSTRQNCSLAML